MNMLSTSTATTDAALMRRQPAAASISAGLKAGGVGGENAADQAREAMGQFVGETFYGALMQQLQKGLGQHNPMSGGRGEEIFRGELNQLIVRQMAAQGDFKLAEAAVDQIFRNTPYSNVCSPERAGRGTETAEGIFG